MQKWDHAMLTPGKGETVMELLSEYGQQGWELVAVTVDEGNVPTLYMKRPEN
jgi:hypothetical protein